MVEEEPLVSYMSSPEYNMFSDTDTETEPETDETETVKDETETSCDSGSLRHQPKFIVFLSKLLLLFNVCPTCKTNNPFVETQVIGTMVEVTTKCFNPHCPHPKNVWQSQPNMTGTKMPAMNFLLCFSILVSGASPSKVFQVFKHMGLSCISLKTYFKHQGEKLFPTIHLFWKKYQEQMFEKLRETGQSLVIAGDGRHDSMGHSAKYCAYTVFCCTIPLIIEFSMVQRNVAGSSPAMEMLGFKKCMDALMACGLVLGTLITDRHSSIIKHMRENLGHITHYFDLWHLKKKIHKVLIKVSKEKDCSALTEWIKPCENHFMWSATSTLSGDGNVIWAKFKSFFSHVRNKHTDLDDPVFNKCVHGEEISERKWLEEDTTVYERMCKELKNPSLIKGIRQASPMAQTSCLEGFHSVVNQYAPKMIAYSYQGMYCSYLLLCTLKHT
ncbi:hypothetical protein QZH41_010164 [Actinostola sp. cb2023]|nr:hypothetical protein QZH41_010164 [Actinostola sp. cb2023]